MQLDLDRADAYFRLGQGHVTEADVAMFVFGRSDYERPDNSFPPTLEGYDACVKYAAGLEPRSPRHEGRGCRPTASLLLELIVIPPCSTQFSATTLLRTCDCFVKSESAAPPMLQRILAQPRVAGALVAYKQGTTYGPALTRMKLRKLFSNQSY